MAYRFWRRIKIAPGLTLNLSKSGASISAGPRGAKITVGSRGPRVTAGIPGTGLFYTRRLKEADATGRLTLGFFKRLFTPSEERALIEGCRRLVEGDAEGALESLRRSVHLADGACLAGFLALKLDAVADAERYLRRAASQARGLGTTLGRYGVAMEVDLPITENISASLGTDLRSVLLGLVEVYQRGQRWEDALECLRRLRRLEPDDIVIKLSLGELLLDAKGDDKRVCRQVVELARGIENETEIHAALLLQKGRALKNLGLLDAARQTLTAALRRKKGRSEDLLRSLRYERALVYEAAGRSRQARKDLETIYAEDPGFQDVARRLGL